MFKNHNTYIASFSSLLLAAGTMQIPAFTINSACRRIFVKSILWQFIIRDTTNVLLIPEENNTIIQRALTIATVPPANFFSVVETMLPPAPDFNSQIAITKSGQYYFNNLRFDNAVAFTLEFDNLSAAIDCNVSTYLLIETTE